jgi:glutamate N-acetyltransferase/amino-acid N-acetyltransferase
MNRPESKMNDSGFFFLLMREIAMNVTEEFVMPKGFQAAGEHVGLKRKRKDLALLVSEVPAEFAVALTTNVVKAAPILWNQKVDSAGGKIKAIVVNSGNANSCTGAAGVEHTWRMASKTANCLNADAGEILIASTGVIGVPLPIEKVEAGIELLAPKLDTTVEAGLNATQAIMTTDQFAKYCHVQFEIGGETVTMTGIAKGSGMIHPNMATMLSFLLTDANISKALLKKALLASVQTTYNMISVDGDTSTNDMVAIMANAEAANDEICEGSAEWETFVSAIEAVNTFLAKCIARDGEGATKLLTVTVQGSKNIEEAQKLSKSVVSSNLVKTAMFGQDANWGRIVAALGYGGVKFDPAKVSVELASEAGRLALLLSGEPCSFSEAFALEVMKRKDIEVLIDLNDGLSKATAWGCDLTYDYVRINGAYRT